MLRSEAKGVLKTLCARALEPKIIEHRFNRPSILASPCTCQLRGHARVAFRMYVLFWMGELLTNAVSNASIWRFCTVGTGSWCMIAWAWMSVLHLKKKTRLTPDGSVCGPCLAYFIRDGLVKRLILPQSETCVLVLPMLESSYACINPLKGGKPPFRQRKKV